MQTGSQARKRCLVVSCPCPFQSEFLSRLVKFYVERKGMNICTLGHGKEAGLLPFQVQAAQGIPGLKHQLI